MGRVWAEIESWDVADQVDQHPVVRAATPGRDRDLQHRDRQPRADNQREREHHDVEQPQRPAENPNLAGDGRRRRRPGPARTVGSLSRCLR